MHLDSIFQSLADHTRRDMLRRIAKKDMTVGELAEHYDMSFAAVSKHLKVLEHATLIEKRKEGRSQWITLKPKALHEADQQLERYRKMWESRFNKLDDLLK